VKRHNFGIFSFATWRRNSIVWLHILSR